MKFLAIMFLASSVFATDRNSSADLDGKPWPDEFDLIAFAEPDELLPLSRVKKNLFDTPRSKKRIENTKEIKKYHALKAGKAVKKEIIIAHEADGIAYFAVSSEALEKALLVVDNLSGDQSYDLNFYIDSKNASDQQFRLSLDSPLAAIIPLLEEAVALVNRREETRGMCVIRMTLRIDPNCMNLKQNLNRQIAQTWHNHPGSDSYIFTLTRDDHLTTMVMHEGVVKHTEKNKLFLLKDSIQHRTPDIACGARIHFTIGLNDSSDVETAVDG